MITNQVSSFGPYAAVVAAVYHEEYKVTVYDNIFVGIVYGVHIVLYATSVYILLSRQGFTSSRLRKFMFGITTFMFVLGTIILVLETALGFQEMKLFLDLTPGSIWSPNRINVIITTFSRLMFILSDIICAWRAVVLWNRDKRVVAILLLIILATTAAAGCDLGLNLVPLDGPHYDSNLSMKDESNVNLGKRTLIWIGPTLVTNLLSTGLIAWKFWQHRILVRKHLNEGSRSMRVNRIFAMLIESGCVYSCLWICYFLISAFRVLPGPGFLSVVDFVLVFVSALYTTLIVILVGLQMSPVEYHSTHSTGMQFTSGPAPVPPSMSQHVYMIGREYVSNSDTRVTSVVFMKISEEEKSPSVG